MSAQTVNTDELNKQKELDNLKIARDIAEVKAAIAKANTEQSDAEKAKSEADLAALKKKFGDFSGSNISGTADLNTDAGSTEATLLGSVAINRIADQFAQSLLDKITQTNIILATPATAPDFQALTAFELQYTAIEGAIISARATTDAKIEGVPIATVGAAAEAISKLLSYAKTDYKFTNLKIESSEAMLVNALAGKLDKKWTVEVPAIYVADIISQTKEFFARATNINTWGNESKYRAKYYEEQINKAEKDPTSAQNKEILAAQRDALAKWKSMAESIDAWSKILSTADDKGNAPIAAVAREFAIKSKLNNGGVLLIVELHKVSGTAYTKKNLWSSLFGNPLFVMGGAIASYVALDGKNGKVLGAQMLPIHGGYLSVNDITAAVNSDHR